jgi:hypothetical protein
MSTWAAVPTTTTFLDAQKKKEKTERRKNELAYTSPPAFVKRIDVSTHTYTNFHEKSSFSSFWGPNGPTPKRLKLHSAPQVDKTT